MSGAAEERRATPREAVKTDCKDREGNESNRNPETYSDGVRRSEVVSGIKSGRPLDLKSLD